MSVKTTETLVYFARTILLKSYLTAKLFILMRQDRKSVWAKKRPRTNSHDLYSKQCNYKGMPRQNVDHLNDTVSRDELCKIMARVGWCTQVYGHKWAIS